MTKSKMKFGALLAVMLIVSMALVPAVSAAEALNEETVPEIVTTELPELIAEPLPELPVNSALATEYNPLSYLVDIGNDEQKILLGYIDNSYLSDEEKKDMNKAMKDIWKRQPTQLSEEDNLLLETVFKASAEYYVDTYGKKDVGVAWSPDQVHDNIARISVTKWGINPYYANIAGNAAVVPDGWSGSQIWQSLNHYFNPDIPMGLAPVNAQLYGSRANDYWNDGSLTNAYTNLGYSSHFLSDVGNPLHTDLEAEQALNQQLHYDYESYVSDNWDSVHNFSAIVTNNNNYYTVVSPAISTTSLAIYSNPDAFTIYWTIFFYPTSWEESTSIKTITENVLLRTAKYNLGLVKYMRS